MSTPNKVLMEHYKTDKVYMQKTAGAAPYIGLIAGALLARHLMQSGQQTMDLQQQQAMQLNEQFRIAEMRRFGQANENARHTRVPIILPYDTNIPVGWDEGMVRLASAIGEDMAKQASLSKKALSIATMQSAGAKAMQIGGPRLAKFQSNIAATGQRATGRLAQNLTAQGATPHQVVGDIGRSFTTPQTDPTRSVIGKSGAGLSASLGIKSPMEQSPMKGAQSFVGSVNRQGGADKYVQSKLNVPQPMGRAPRQMEAVSTGAGSKPGVISPVNAGHAPVPPTPIDPNASVMDKTFGKHWFGKGMLAGGALLGGYAATKTLDKGLGVLGQESQPPIWGGGVQIPAGVNGYGYPQLGTPLY